MRDLLVVAGVARRFGRARVLRGASLVVRRGELVGVVGENGAGKSTLLQIVVGRLARDAGTVEVSGRLAWCPQHALVFERLTLWENFRYFAAAYGLHGWEVHVEALMRRYRFERYAGHLVAQVSGGTRQKLNLALALLPSPELLVLDEPYAGFDWETYLTFWEHASELRAEGRGILVVSHLLHDRERFDRVYTLADGVATC